jgi:hypothetical protein
MTERRREAQRLRILTLVKGGMSYDFIATQEDIPRPRVRQIVIEAVQRDPDALDIDSHVIHAALLAPALKLAEDEIERGNLAAIDKLIRVMDLMHKLNPHPQEPVSGAFAHEIKGGALTIPLDRSPGKGKTRKSPSEPSTH